MEADILARRLNLNGLRILLIHPESSPQFSVVDLGEDQSPETPTPALVSVKLFLYNATY